MSLLKVPFYYVRHGQTDWNLESRAMGQKDIPLNANGIEQALAARHSLTDCAIQTICFSPLSRAKKTAEIFNEVLQCEMVEIEELREFHLGDYAGQIKGAWFTNWRLGHALESAETYEEFLGRTLVGVNRALDRQGPVLIVGHGGVYWTIQHHGNILQDFDLPNCTPVYHKPFLDDSGLWHASLLQISPQRKQPRA